MKYLEKYLTQIPTYLLVNGALGFLIVLSLLLSLFGIFPFPALALILTNLVFIGVSMVASYGFAKLYGISSHLQSAMITGLLLTFLFTPSTKITTLLQYGLIALISQGSKFIIAFKGRHIFNPAAFGALLGGLLQLQFASWWIATPALLIPVIFTAFLILYKTRELLLGSVFIALSLLMLVITGVNIWTAASSWPLLFLAGFMLDEPATLPPRKEQRLGIAIIVATVVSLPFHIGWFYSSPEFALVIGNLVAFALAFKQRKGIKLQLKARTKLTPTTEELVFATSKPITFEPGQYIELTLPHHKPDMRGLRRSFSITNAPYENELRLGVKFNEPGSTFKNKLAELSPEAIIQTTGVAGDFTLPKDNKAKLLFIAGGIGITPFISHIKAHANRDITLLYFVPNAKEIAYKNLLDSSGVKVTYFTTRGKKIPGVESGRLSANTIQKHVPDASERIAYISGPPTMVNDAKKQLKGKVKKIKTDYFNGY
ncbi:MAG: FAD-dependent oxidoreductase [Micrococcaceae bacterium]